MIQMTAGDKCWRDEKRISRWELDFRFVRDHHRKIKKIAIVTNSLFGEAAEHIVSHFAAATIKHFPSGYLDQAKRWLASISQVRHFSFSAIMFIVPLLP